MLRRESAVQQHYNIKTIFKKEKKKNKCDTFECHIGIIIRFGQKSGRHMTSSLVVVVVDEEAV